MKLSFNDFFEKHSHLKIGEIAEAAGIKYQYFSRIRAGKMTLTQDMADRLNAAISKLTAEQQKDSIKPQKVQNG